MTFFTRTKELARKVTERPWRVKNELDPNPIFEQMHGKEYKTMFYIQARGIDDTPSFSTLTNVTPAKTHISQVNAEYIVHCVNNFEKVCELLEITIKKLSNIHECDPSPDLSHHKYVDAIRFVKGQCEEAMKEIQTELEKMK